VLQKLGSEHVLVVHGKNGMDEISPAGPTLVGELRNGEVREYEIQPEQFGLPLHDLAGLKVADAQESKEVVLTVLHGDMGAARDTVLLNAGAALYAAGVADSMADGIERARHSIDSGAAKVKLDSLVRFTQSCEPPPQQ
jgi:anthranilate phosphoribosyltransferase